MYIIYIFGNVYGIDIVHYFFFNSTFFDQFGIDFSLAEISIEAVIATIFSIICSCN